MQLDLHAYRESDVDEIPSLPGIYAFYLDLIGPGSCGIRAGQRVDVENHERIRANLRRRLSAFVSIFRNQTYLGDFSDTRRSDALKRTFELSAQERVPQGHLDDLDRLSNEELDYLLVLGKRATFFVQPLYVGIAVEQTLQQRYTQHFRAFQGADDTNVFGVRLRKAGIRWDDVLFVCVDLPIANISASGLSFLETQLHSLQPPIFSIR